jgi:hypothetical protein
MVLYAGSSERARITSGGNLDLQKNIGLGGTSATTSGTGITFPATQSASSNANTLDDYEEGDWTPVLGASTSVSGQTYSRQTGKYTKVGRLVTCTFDVVLTAKGTLSGLARISGLPFTSGSNTGFRAAFNVGDFFNLGTSYVWFGGIVPDGAVVVNIGALTAAATTTTAPNGSDAWSDTTQLIGTITYMV